MMPVDDKPEKIEFFSPPSPKDYWIIFAHSLDWQIMLHRLVITLDPSHGKDPLDPKIAFIGFDGKEATPVYYLSREYFPVETIARFIGKPTAALAGIETMHLREIKGEDGEPAQKGWQTSTVDYWGMA
jgi:hypothetical protein